MFVPDRATYGESRYVPDEIVVAIPHLRPVLQRLAADDLGIHPESIDASESLGLALVPLPEAEMVRWDGRRVEPHAAPAPRLDALLRFLHDHFEQSSSWTPTIGKNRAIDEVVGGDHTIGVGDEGFPALPDVRAELRPRDGDPGAGVVVGVADTALHRNEWMGGGYQAPPSTFWRAGRGPLRYESGHAGFLAGAVLQRAPGAVVSVRQVLGDDGLADSWSVAKALVRFERLGVDVLNPSLGHFTGDDQEPLVMTTALNRLDPDLVVIASAGNHGKRDRRPLGPAALPRVVAVGATDDDGAVQAGSSSRGTSPWVDVPAPGRDVLSTHITGPVEVDGAEKEFPRGLATWSGTSFTAARVSGSVAARTEPGRKDAATALRKLLAGAPEVQGLPWIR